jgi:hypothetical protein
MHDLMQAYSERRDQEMREHGRLIALAVNDPKKLDEVFKKQDKRAEPLREDGDSEKWW